MNEPGLRRASDTRVASTQKVASYSMSINISLWDLDLADLRPWLRPLDRAVIRTGMKQTIDFFHRRVPDLDDPRWLTVERQNLYDVGHVIQLEVAECNAKNWIATDKLIVQLYEERFVGLGFNDGTPSPTGGEGNNEPEGSEGRSSISEDDLEKGMSEGNAEGTTDGRSESESLRGGCSDYISRDEAH
ncbi:hypothetical protein MIND_00001200 [Mycena indigotica]|uniref:Uncharacterized protein n=1 Tax=Mycena indigotica TaxID=2126181 RepID=A0A8H6TFN0_9AGAR|nr:uncharacterized protein MIND_00001200 [Mycena indigotica]KAF7314875.1 hypothetical protein MIND_00001200 [Mycena indigotica]